MVIPLSAKMEGGGIPARCPAWSLGNRRQRSIWGRIFGCPVGADTSKNPNAAGGYQATTLILSKRKATGRKWADRESALESSVGGSLRGDHGQGEQDTSEEPRPC